MNPIKLKNQTLIKLLSNITKEFYSEQVVSLLSSGNYKREDEDIPNINSCSEEYFIKARTFPIELYAFPRSAIGVNNDTLLPKNYDSFDNIRKKLLLVGNFLGTHQVALSMLYPDNGYIGWHHNGNAPGYNILFTYSQDGDGYFKYYDYKTESFVTINDNPGWNAKVGYYPDEKIQPEKVFWHCAETKLRRITIAFVVKNKKLWENMIENVCEDDFDRKILDVD